MTEEQLKSFLFLSQFSSKVSFYPILFTLQLFGLGELYDIGGQIGIEVGEAMQGISLHHHLHLPIQNNKNRWERVSVKANKGSEEGDKAVLPSMCDILEASRAQKVEVQLKTVGPFFRIIATSLESRRELGRAEGLVRIWFPGTKILHLDSIKLRRETLNMEKSIFGLGLFIGAVAIRHGYDSGCTTAQLLAINDSDLYHSKLVRFYRRLGFREVYQVSGSSIGDIPHMLVWGGVGTRMDACIQQLMFKWCTRFKKIKTVDK
ncbi:hypothetical protein PIB30_034430 [Stylosanthes scabra]|uniref:N-acetyltransferase domain-containing protein n=1 Tax=Stylosanthes scabra TaxID=79078 RepID=A0ABU6SCY8_9FABA|nr:hypothetical protein [Stylosanthes scabra]